MSEELRNPNAIYFDKDDPLSRSRTIQSQKSGADINNIMKKYTKTGVLGDPLTASLRKPMYGDFSQCLDYQSSLNKLIQVKRDFDELPIEVKKACNNDPQKLVDLVTKEELREDAYHYGILERPKPIINNDIEVPNEIPPKE